MIEQIRSTYIQVLEDTKLLDKETKDFAVKKIKAMEKQVAYPQDYKNLTLIQMYYDHVSCN